MTDGEAREQFQKQAIDLQEILDKLRPGTGPGVKTLVMQAWDEGRKAGRLAGLEEAAKIAETFDAGWSQIPAAIRQKIAEGK